MIELAWIGPASAVVILDGRQIKEIAIHPHPYNGRPSPYYRGRPYGWFDAHVEAAEAAVRIVTGGLGDE